MMKHAGKGTKGGLHCSHTAGGVAVRIVFPLTSLLGSGAGNPSGARPLGVVLC